MKPCYGKFWNEQLNIFSKVMNRRVDEVKESENNIIIKRMVQLNFTGLPKEEIIETINKNTNESNREDNEIIIKYLNGDEACIWKLYIKYEGLYKSVFNKEKIFNKEIDIEAYDIVTDSFFDVIKKIKFGKYMGLSFKSYSCEFVSINTKNYSRNRLRTIDDNSELFNKY